MNAPEPKGTFKQVGTRPVRPDGVEKVTGKAIFGTDYKAANMLHGAIVRSPHPHARIKSIDTGKAEAVPGVKAVVTGADFPEIDDVMVRTGEVASSTLAADRKLFLCNYGVKIHNCNHDSQKPTGSA